MPLNGPGRGGRVGTNYTHYMMKHIMKDTTHDEDPRTALLSYAKQAEGKTIRWIDYKKKLYNIKYTYKKKNLYLYLYICYHKNNIYKYKYIYI